jgi:hypothetical protein
MRCALRLGGATSSPPRPSDPRFSRPPVEDRLRQNRQASTEALANGRAAGGVKAVGRDVRRSTRLNGWWLSGVLLTRTRLLGPKRLDIARDSRFVFRATVGREAGGEARSDPTGRAKGAKYLVLLGGGARSRYGPATPALTATATSYSSHSFASRSSDSAMRVGRVGGRARRWPAAQ